MNQRAEYIIKLFRQIYNVPEELRIAYGREQEADIVIPDLSDSFFEGQDALPPSVGQKVWKEYKIPVFFCCKDDQWYDISGKSVRFRHDIIASAFYILSGWHEYHSDSTDHHGRYPYRGSIAETFDIADIPVVNIYFAVLAEAIGRLCGQTVETRKWQGKDFALCLTHDVDKCKSGWMEDGRSAIGKGQAAGAVRLLAQRISGRDPWFNFDKIIALEQKNDVRSCFYFIPEKGKGNADYDLCDESFDAVYRMIIAAGSECGLHAALGSAVNVEHLKRNLSGLRKPAIGMRCHYLQYDPKISPGVMAAAGLGYDSSIAFAEKAGFRRGICHPFPIYDLASNSVTGVTEVPLLLMDTSFQQKKYSGGGIASALKTSGELMHTVARFGGCMTVLWHNNFFSDYKYAGWGAAYEQIITAAKESNAAFVLPKEAAKFI